MLKRQSKLLIVNKIQVSLYFYTIISCVVALQVKPTPLIHLGSAKTVSAVEKAVDIPVIPPPKPPRRTTSVTMKTAMTPSTNKTSRRHNDLDYKIYDVQAE